MSDNTGLFVQPVDTMPEIKSIWAFVQVDPEDRNEGVCAVMLDGAWLPLIASDKVRLDEYISIAKRIATETNREVKLVKFMQREELETFKP